jgi:hypothetical protein
MKHPILAAAALLAAVFLSSNASAMPTGQAKSLHTAGSTVKIGYRCCNGGGCGACGAYRYTVYRSCGRGDLYAYATYEGCRRDYGYTNYRCGCGCGHCSCGYGYGGCGYRGWSLFGWLR